MDELLEILREDLQEMDRGLRKIDRRIAINPAVTSNPGSRGEDSPLKVVA
jgi:hypothetical protein